MLLFKARGSDFEWQGNTLASLNADVDIEPGRRPAHAGQVDLAALQYGGRTLQKVSARILGQNRSRSASSPASSADPLRLAMTAEGVIAGRPVAGPVHHLHRRTRQQSRMNLKLKLAAPAPLHSRHQRRRLRRTVPRGHGRALLRQRQRAANGAWRASSRPTPCRCARSPRA